MYAQAIFTTLTRWGMHLLLILGVTISQATFGLAGQEKEQSQKPVANPKKIRRIIPKSWRLSAQQLSKHHTVLYGSWAMVKK